MSSDVIDRVSAGPKVEPQRAGPSQRTRRVYLIALVSAIVVLAFGVRLALFTYHTSDYLVFYRRWYDFIIANGRFSALR
jgi:hypothetical protein